MNLHAILCWWDESPTWLGATVASLGTIGVDHVIAVDGRYPHFQPTAPVTSRSEQLEAIHLNATAIGARVTLHQPIDALTEVEKRTRAFELLNTTARSFTDWVCVIDADEVVTNGTHAVRAELDAINQDTHVAQVMITNVEDPHAKPGPDNDVRPATERLYQTHHAAQPAFTAMQSRFFRVLDRMSSDTNHWAYTGHDRDGRKVFLRNDTGRGPTVGADYASDIHMMDEPVEWLHRKNHRIAHRREEKVAYYQLRDELGLER
jgi:hypothetical protein